jgi:hypothetical protein
MGISVKGEQVKLLELSMIRRYGTLTPFVDPTVAKILVSKGFAIYINVIKKIEEKRIEISENMIFPKEIIKV